MSVNPITAEELEFLMLLEQLEGSRSILDFLPFISKGYEAPHHLKPLADVLYRCATEGNVRACVSLPPRFGKTEILLHFISWYLLRYPQKTVGYVSYATTFAESKSRKARDLAERAGVRLREDIRSVKEWRTMDGGGLLATGIGGPLTGQGLDIALIDDPTKNREEAESPIIRQRNSDWFTSTLLTRLEPGGSAVVVHTRWHDDDLIGRLAQDTETQWEIINIPAVDDTGKSLWPSRWSEDALDRKRREVGPYDFASMFMGQPRPKGGRMFDEPARYLKADLTGARLVISCDPAASEKTNADFSAIVVLAAKGYGVDQTVYVLDVFRDRVLVPKLVQHLLRLQKHYASPIAIESVAGFKGVAQALRDIDPQLKVYEVAPQTDKFTRAIPCSAAWNDGRVRVPMEAPWLKTFLDEVRLFTGVKDARDDQIDALAQGFNIVHRASPPLVRGSIAAPQFG